MHMQRALGKGMVIKMKAKKVLSFFLAALMGAGIAGIPAAAIDTDFASGTEYTVQYEYPRMPEGYSIQKNIEDILSEYLSDEKAASYFTNDIQLYSSDYTSNYLFYVKQRCGSDANYKTMDKAADNVIAMMDKKWSDMTKVVFLNDYFTSTKKYDLTYTKYSAYNLLVENTAVCQGYAEAFWYIMYKLGIDCKLVSSDSLNHAWNLVKIDNSWYHIDTTWNDPVPDVEGSSHHDFLLLSDTEMGLTNHNATDWVLPYENNASAFNYAVSTKYDSYFWKNTTTPIIIKNNRFYYRHDKKILSADVNNNSQTIRATGSGNWSVWGNSNSYWAGDFGSLVNSGNYLIYNTPTSIMYCDLNGNNAAALYSLSKSELSEGYIYGLFVDGSTLRYRLATAPQYTSYKDHTLTLPFAVPVTPKLTVTAGDSRAVLSWGAVSNATRYRTFYRLTGTSAWTSSGDIKSTSNTITGLINGRQYDFLVLAGNNSTFSSWNDSDIVKAVPQAVPVTPKLTVTAGNSRAVLSWGAVSNATRYRTFYRLTGTSAWTSSGDIRTTSNTITGLSNGRQYDFLVLAGNNSTFSAWSNSDIVKAVPQAAAVVPVTPELTVSVSSGRADLSWNTVPNATRYRSFCRPTGTSAWSSSNDMTSTSCIISGLTNGQQYDFLVLAGNSTTFSSWNNSDIVRVYIR